MKKVSIFVDGGSLFCVQKDVLQWWVDPKKLLEWAQTKGEVVNARYYTITDDSNEAQQRYLKALASIGYSVQTRELRRYVQEDGTEKFKGNLDVDIVLDMFNHIDRYEEAILVSGNTEFARPLRVLQARHKSFWVLSTQGFISQELLQVAGTHYIDIGSLRAQLEKD